MYYILLFGRLNSHFRSLFGSTDRPTRLTYLCNLSPIIKQAQNIVFADVYMK